MRSLCFCAERTLLMPTMKWKTISMQITETFLANRPPESVTVVDKAYKIMQQRTCVRGTYNTSCSFRRCCVEGRFNTFNIYVNST
jgi:hypothetical protein